jgi:phosphoglucosamine mutase
MKNYFGTDGIRGRTGSGNIQPETILKLGWAAGMVLKDQNSNEVLIGKDTRVSGYMLESALESGLAAAGVNIGLLGPMPTPAVSYLTATFRCAAGIVISASHNPYYDNGIKFFGHDGKKLSNEIEQQINYYMTQPLNMVETDQIGKARRIDGAPDRYIEFCKSKLIPDLSLKGLTIAIDCANGATYHIAESIFTELGANTIMLANKPNGFNINENCGSTCPGDLQQLVIKNNADLGIAYDGDGDRVILVNQDGAIIDGDAIVYILAMHLKNRKKLNNAGVVGTVMTNMGVENALQHHQIPFIRTSVGDKNVMAKLEEQGWFLGGESSGHIINLKKTISGDGIITSLLVLNAMLEQQLSIDELLKDYQNYPSELVAIKCEAPQEIIKTVKMQKLIQQATKDMGNKGRVLIRASGTEPKIRLMLESIDENLINTMLPELTTKINSIITEENKCSI